MDLVAEIGISGSADQADLVGGAAEKGLGEWPLSMNKC